jgi:hypothetical protein
MTSGYMSVEKEKSDRVERQVEVGKLLFHEYISYYLAEITEVIPL